MGGRLADFDEAVNAQRRDRPPTEAAPMMAYRWAWGRRSNRDNWVAEMLEIFWMAASAALGGGFSPANRENMATQE